jgi:hypothetical protein
MNWVYAPQITPESKAFRSLKAERARQAVREHFKVRNNAAIER